MNGRSMGIGKLWLAGAACLLALVMSSLAHAQTGRGTTTNGMFGSRTLGAGSRSNTQRQGAAGQVGNGAALEQAQEGVGQVTGNERFVRGNRQGAFVGADAGDTTTIGSQVQGTRQPNFGNLFQNLFNQNGPAFTNDNNNRGNTPLRIPIRLGFEARPIATSQVTTQFTTRLTKLPAFRSLGPVEVLMEGQTAVLRGVVASDADRQLAAEMAMLEPAVLDVRNELVVGPVETKDDPQTPPPPAPGLP